MSFLSGLFGTKYQDEAIVSHVQTALHEDPLLTDTAALSVRSEKGVVRLSGTVHKAQQKERVEDIVRHVLGISGLKYEQIVNELTVD